MYIKIPQKKKTSFEKAIDFQKQSLSKTIEGFQPSRDKASISTVRFTFVALIVSLSLVAYIIPADFSVSMAALLLLYA
ncbi:hypothetical protein HY546_00940 [archaeon]|nr:hypothetical protein [archaeon]